MNAKPEALKRAHIKPGDKFYHGGHGTHHFSEGHDLHLQGSVVDRLVEDGLLAAEPPEAETTDEQAADASATEAAPTAELQPETQAEGDHQA